MKISETFWFLGPVQTGNQLCNESHRERNNFFSGMAPNECFMYDSYVNYKLPKLQMLLKTI